MACEVPPALLIIGKRLSHGVWVEGVAGDCLEQRLAGSVDAGALWIEISSSSVEPGAELGRVLGRESCRQPGYDAAGFRRRVWGLKVGSQHMRHNQGNEKGVERE